MGAVTYPNAEVQSYIERRFVPVQFNVIDEPEWKERFNSSWTPTLIVQDPEGREHRRSQGYLDPERFVGEMALAYLKDAVDRQDFKEAMRRSEEAFEMTQGDEAREPEARYWAAVAAYKGSDDSDNNLSEGWNRLIDEFPQSEWAKRAGFIRGRG